MINAEQQQAINEFAAKNGAQWRDKLREAWRTGSDVSAIPQGYLLRQIRNNVGPSRLEQINAE